MTMDIPYDGCFGPAPAIDLPTLLLLLLAPVAAGRAMWRGGGTPRWQAFAHFSALWLPATVLVATLNDLSEMSPYRDAHEYAAERIVVNAVGSGVFALLIGAALLLPMRLLMRRVPELPPAIAALLVYGAWGSLARNAQDLYDHLSTVLPF